MNDMRVVTLRVVAMAVLIISAGCTNSGVGDTTTTDATVGNSPTEAAQQANNEIRAVPDGHFDCDTAGPPYTTTTLGEFFAREVLGRCIFDAAGSGEPAVQSFYAGDNAGGIDGTIVRIDGPNDITVTTYHIDDAGHSNSTDTECPDLAASPTSPPMCAFP